VVFEDVHFSYDPDKPLITGLNVVAEPGQTVAIVGPTGAGKTTLVNLIMRFYDLDGGPHHARRPRHRELPRDELRSEIGMVLQDTWLFGGTIRDNLRYGNPDATDEQIVEAAKVTYVDRFVHSLPDGYDTDDQRRGRQHLHRREAADDHRPGVPRRPVDPDPRRGDQLGRHPHRGADPGGDERAA
jgi:ATP-binding cassette, subfamily B, multidrug efflux pump